MIDLLMSFIVPFTVGMATAVITVWMALRRFRAERWWERRADAYTKILESLHYVKRSLEDTLSSIEENRPPRKDERQKELNKRSIDAHDELRKAVDLSSFLLSADAVSLLKELMDRRSKAIELAWSESHPYEGMLMEFKAVEECLTQIANLAKRDLSVS